ncbi:MAG: cytochrome c biogenesis protein [Anaerolineae bacterium]
MNEKRELWEKRWYITATKVLGLGAGIVLLIALFLALFWAPPARDAETGAIVGPYHRIMYFHIPSAWVAFLAFFVVFLASVLYLWKRTRVWDILALSSAEIGVLFATLVLLTGPIWAKAAWGIWWTWDARLTTTLILWLIYVAYLMLRSYAQEGSQGATFAAVLGIVGFLDVPIIFLSVEWWRTQHPELIVIRGGGLAPEMLRTLMIALLSFTLLYFYLLLQRVRVEGLKERLSWLKDTFRIP